MNQHAAPPRPHATPAAADRAGRWLLLAVAAAYLPLIFMGYGTDSDTYATLEMGRHLRDTGAYVPSRDPGYPLFEGVMAMLAPLGGSVLTNAVSLALGLWTLHSLLSLTRAVDARPRLAVVAAVAVHPLFAIAATSSHDFVWALALVLATARAVVTDRPLRAGLWAGLGAACRLQSLPVTLGFLVLGAWRGRSRRWAAALGLAGGLAVLAYLPAAAASGWSPGFLRVGMGDAAYWTPLLRLGKFLYKNLDLWGLPAAVVLAGAVAACVRGGTPSWRAAVRRRPGLAEALLAVAVTEAVFLAFPIEREYLLPVLPFLLLFLGGLGCLRRLAPWLVAAVALLGVVDLNVARPDTPGAATGARVGLWLERGDLLRDVERRLVLRDVDTMEGYVDSLRAFRRRRGLGPSAELEALARPPQR